MTRTGVVFSGAILAAVLGLRPAAAQIWTPSPAHDITGVWWTETYSPTIRPADGSAIPFTPAGRAQYEKNKAGFKDGSVGDLSRAACVSDGVPRALASPYPFLIVQTRGLITMVFERNWSVREVAMDKPMPADKDLLPWFMGNPVGHWDGNTLVVETKGFKNTSFLDDSGLPHSDALHLIERIRKLEGGSALEDVVTIDDPKIFARPWTARFVYKHRPDVRMQEYVCHEQNRDVSSVKGVP